SRVDHSLDHGREKTELVASPPLELDRTPGPPLQERLPLSASVRFRTKGRGGLRRAVKCPKRPICGHAAERPTGANSRPASSALLKARGMVAISFWPRL